MTTLGFAFFIFTTIAAYTANLAAFMVQQASAPRIESIEQAVAAGMWLCGERKSIMIVQLTYPTAKFVEDDDGVAGFNTRVEVFDKIDQGICDAGIAVLEDLDQQHGAEGGLHCDKFAVGQPVAYTSVGMPLNPLKADMLRANLLKLVANGRYADILQKARPSSACHP